MATNLPPFSFMPGYHRYFREDIFERIVLFEKYIKTSSNTSSNTFTSPRIYTREYDVNIMPSFVGDNEFITPGVFTIETDFSFVPAPTFGTNLLAIL